MEFFDQPIIIANSSQYMKINMNNIDLTNVSHTKILNVHWIPLSMDTLISPALKEQLGILDWPYLPPVTLHRNVCQFVSPNDYYQRCDCIALLDAQTGRFIDSCHPVVVPDLPVDFVLGTFQFYYFDRGEREGRLVVCSEERQRVREARDAEMRCQGYKNLL